MSAPAATSVLLCLFDEGGAPMGEELPLEKDGAGVWSGLVEGLPKKGVLYGWAAAKPRSNPLMPCTPGCLVQVDVN